MPDSQQPVPLVGARRRHAAAAPSIAVPPPVIPPRNTACYDTPMPNVRFTISTASEMLAAIKAHAETAGMDVSAYMIAAAVAQMYHDDVITASLAPLDEANRAAMEQGALLPEEDEPAFEDLSEEDKTWLRNALRGMLGPSHPEIP